MDELKHALEQLSAGGPRLKAIVVDDDFESLGIPSFAEWMTLRDELQETSPKLHDDLLECLLAEKHNPEEAPSVDLLAVVVAKLSVTPSATETTALNTYMRSEHLLQKLRRFLDQVGFDVSCFTKQPAFVETELPFLCLVDYQILPEEESGDTAQRIFEQLMRCAESAQRPPPFVILMSKALSDADVNKWTALAERAGFFRFNYGFLNKEQFLSNSAHLMFPLLHFVKHEKLSKAYFLQMNSLVTEASGVARNVARKLFQVTPPEALLFRERAFEEGTSLSSELTSLFAELFSSDVQASTKVVARMNILEKVITDHGVPVPYRQQRSALHRLYAELLHQRWDGANIAPCFGDIFEDADATYFLVISQECDLAGGELRKRKTDRVMALEGELRNTLPSKNDGEMMIAKPIFIAGNEQPMWLWWNLMRPVVLPLTRFAQTLVGEFTEEPFAPVRPTLKKRWKLRFADAEDIQHKFATRMTRVALSIMPEFVQVHSFRCSRNGQIIDGIPPVYVYEVQKEKKIALAPESQGTCCVLDNGTYMSKALISKLSVFVPIDTFKLELETESLLAFTEGENLLLAKTTPEFRRGKKPWKGSA
jgi:hypothetical protein